LGGERHFNQKEVNIPLKYLLTRLERKPEGIWSSRHNRPWQEIFGAICNGALTMFWHNCLKNKEKLSQAIKYLKCDNITRSTGGFAPQ